MRVQPLLLPLAWLALATPALAQAEGHAQASVAVEPAVAKPGETVEVVVTIAIDDAWHIYGTATENGLPTAIEIDWPPGLVPVGGLEAPEVEQETIEFVGPVSLHRGTPRFSQRATVAAGQAEGPLAVPVEVTWQACDDANTACVTGEAQLEASLTVLAGQASPAAGPADGGDPNAGGPGLGFGEDLGFGGQLADDGNHVELTVSLSKSTARPGETIELIVDASVEDGWHIYTTTETDGVPTHIQLDPSLAERVAVGDLLGPEPEVEELPGGKQLRIHRGTVRFTLPVQVAEAGEIELKGVAVAQACDDANTKCTDREQAFSLSLTVAGEPVEGAVALRPSGGTPSPTRISPPPDPTSSLWGLTVASLGLGILMLLQPCTYPMIPITVSIFSKGDKISRPRAVARAAAYSLGIIVSFVLVAGVVQVVFGAQGQGALSALATNPWVNLIIGLLFLYFAGSFFGYYELGLPAPLMNLMQLGQAKRGGDGTVPVWSLFMMGFFFVLTSYTCGAPVVLALFAQAAQEPHPAAVVFATFVFACVVALPYFALSLIPGAVRALPKSGSWFSVFKVTLGFLEIGFALKFFRGADVMWHTNLLPREAIYGLWTALSVAVVLYLVGRLPLRFPHDPKLRPVSKGRRAWAAGFAALAIYFGLGTAGRRLAEPIETFLLVEPDVDPGLREMTTAELAAKLEIPAAQAQTVIDAREAGMPLASLEDIQQATGFERELALRILNLAQKKIVFGPAPDEGEPDDRLRYRTDLAAYEQLKQQGDGPILLVFTGHNCVNCQLMENGIMQQPEVEARLARAERVALFIDLPGDPDEEANKRFLFEELGNPGTIPAFYVVNSQGEVLAQQVGGTQTAQQFIDFLERGGLGQPASK